MRFKENVIYSIIIAHVSGVVGARQYAKHFPYLPYFILPTTLWGKGEGLLLSAF